MLAVCGRLRVYLLKRQLTEGQKARSVYALSDKKKKVLATDTHICMQTESTDTRMRGRPRALGLSEGRKRRKDLKEAYCQCIHVIAVRVL